MTALHIGHKEPGDPEDTSPAYVRSYFFDAECSPLAYDTLRDQQNHRPNISPSYLDEDTDVPIFRCLPRSGRSWGVLIHGNTGPHRVIPARPASRLRRARAECPPGSRAGLRETNDRTCAAAETYCVSPPRCGAAKHAGLADWCSDSPRRSRSILCRGLRPRGFQTARRYRGTAPHTTHKTVSARSGCGAL